MQYYIEKFIILSYSLTTTLPIKQISFCISQNIKLTSFLISIFIFKITKFMCDFQYHMRDDKYPDQQFHYDTNY